eukprot:CAMPEP_0115521854 /NCGR_PEP_ID=MMETSP0271-20121206/79771_1 /TAXON_ID=71861 /ORGANISM="Scrippsiella trochoidea, Strain CCMP3099" /LENGTH=167 /DNA_ID=CAMNT_0002953119 /DNA_START=112 /DNA_END=612 /DNA_ORIENTATION=+
MGHLRRGVAIVSVVVVSLVLAHMAAMFAYGQVLGARPVHLVLARMAATSPAVGSNFAACEALCAPAWQPCSSAAKTSLPTSSSNSAACKACLLPVSCLSAASTNCESTVRTLALIFLIFSDLSLSGLRGFSLLRSVVTVDALLLPGCTSGRWPAAASPAARPSVAAT